MGIKEMIARCIERMRAGACASCENRRLCPAGRWQQAFAVPTGDEERAAPRRDQERSSSLSALLRSFVRMVERRPSEETCFRKSVEQAVEPMLASGEAGIDRVARELGMSRQTLYRRLKSEGTTFEEVLEAKRRQLAIRYLGSDRLSVKVVAYRLGFSDSAAFSRAFKRWTGSSPSHFRGALQS